MSKGKVIKLAQNPQNTQKTKFLLLYKTENSV